MQFRASREKDASELAAKEFNDHEGIGLKSAVEVESTPVIIGNSGQ